MRRDRIVHIGIVAIAALLFGAFLPTRLFPDPRSRIEHEHGVHLPDSASDFECKGDAQRGFLDRGASSAFLISSNDLAGFVSQLKVRLGLFTFIPGNSQYRLNAA